jgi:hypothetical protein
MNRDLPAGFDDELHPSPAMAVGAGKCVAALPDGWCNRSQAGEKISDIRHKVRLFFRGREQQAQFPPIAHSNSVGNPQRSDWTRGGVVAIAAADPSRLE